MANPDQHSSQHSTDHAHHGASELTYTAVFIGLLILTLLEVGVTYLPIPRLVLVISLLMMAGTKASLVAMYFMHLRFDPRILSVIFVTPLLLGTVLIYFLII